MFFLCEKEEYRHGATRAHRPAPSPPGSPSIRLGSLETGFEKCHGGVPGLRSGFSIVLRWSGFVAEGVRGARIGLDLDAFPLGRSRPEQIGVGLCRPRIVFRLMIQQGTHHVRELIRRRDLAVIGHRGPQPFALAGKTDGQRGAQAESDHAVDVPLRAFGGIEIFAAGVDVLEQELFVALGRQRFRDFGIGRHHAAEPAIEFRDDHTVSLTSQPCAKGRNLRVHAPPVMQEHNPGIRDLVLRPELNAFHMDVFADARADVGIHHRIGRSGNRHSTRKASRAGSNLIQGKWCGLRSHG